MKPLVDQLTKQWETLKVSIKRAYFSERTQEHSSHPVPSQTTSPLQIVIWLEEVDLFDKSNYSNSRSNSNWTKLNAKIKEHLKGKLKTLLSQTFKGILPRMQTLVKGCCGGNGDGCSEGSDDTSWKFILTANLSKKEALSEFLEESYSKPTYFLEFKPYTAEQLQSIIEVRMGCVSGDFDGEQIFPRETIKFLTTLL